MPLDPNARKPIPAPDPFKPVAATLPQVAPISFRDSEALERIRALEDRFELRINELEAEIKTIKESCAKEHSNLAVETSVVRAHLNAHMKSPNHHFYSTGSGFLVKPDEDEIR
jgi:hypothetical protein